MFVGFVRIPRIQLLTTMPSHDQKRDVVDQASAFGLKLGLRVEWCVTGRGGRPG